jgi:hypothetical protein
MPDPIVTNNDLGSVIFRSGNVQDRTFDGTVTGATTLLEGTILAVDSVSLKLVPFVKGGATNENGIPKAVLTYDAAVINGDTAMRPMLSGTFVKERLIILADGDDSNIDVAVRDQLRDYDMLTTNVQELNILDNQ